MSIVREILFFLFSFFFFYGHTPLIVASDCWFGRCSGLWLLQPVVGCLNLITIYTRECR
ncbi:hypothetical protein GGR50DRAFT_681831 [Xylaria sp. CBS 124048]|nr:hypothetical protein GGR50DRAFT_681831 [Xylaria sp. CBS 124048]